VLSLKWHYAGLMSKSDRIKEEIGWLKVVFGLLVATDISLLGWLAQNFATSNRIQIGIALVAVIGVTIAVVWVNRVAYARIDQLEEL
jgi:4-hydroxybenzoate polyprenyltransferase